MTKGEWRWTGLSVAGTSHINRGTPCQDACLVDALPSAGLCAAVSDGAGSAGLAEMGADLTVQAFLDGVRLAGASAASAAPAREAFAGIFAGARRRLEACASQRDCALRDLSATGLVVWVWEGGLAGGQIGDGAIVYGLADEPETLHCLTAPATGEYFNETYFLTHPEYLEYLQFNSVLGCVDRVAIVSDGLQMVSLNLAAKEPHPPFFRRLFDFVRETSDAAERQRQFEALLRSERICERTDDDKTLVIGVRL